ncbi:hypothetical protein [Arthrobacter koreensis]|uniref:hypothetical protein n=1 Tax=Arthrobacter koreensis TaxID=199136 RepID=UPI0038247A49
MSVVMADTSTLAETEVVPDGWYDEEDEESPVGSPPTPPVLMSAGAARVRVPVRLHPDTKERAKYWAAKANVSVNEYMAEAVEEKIRRENGDYDLPTLEIARLGQLIDELRSLSVNTANLEVSVMQMFDSLMGLTRGDNYLLDAENGEIGGSEV